jgi:hypothetical protein
MQQKKENDLVGRQEITERSSTLLAFVFSRMTMNANVLVQIIGA